VRKFFSYSHLCRLARAVGSTAQVFTFSSITSQFGSVSVFDESTGLYCSATTSYQTTSMLVSISPSCVPPNAAPNAVLSVGVIAAISVGAIVGGVAVAIGIVLVCFVLLVLV
jgi:hypothetical protein